MRVETIGDATLYCGDCLEVLQTLPNVDCVITDPPYGIGYTHGGRPANGYADKTVPIIGDDRPFDPSPWLSYQKLILWGANHYCQHLPGTKSWLIWDKRCGTTPDDGADCEMAWTNLGGQTRIYRHLWRGFMRDGEENLARGTSGWKLHPAQKAVALMRWCVDQAGQPKTILDPYMGSGTTGVACAQLGRKFIGVEICEKYFDVACERIDNAYRQQRMEFA